MGIFRRSLLRSVPFLVLASGRSLASVATRVNVYLTPSCGCCRAWIRHLQLAGFTTELRMLNDLTAIKREFRIPEEFWACHSARIGEYFIEGHVPHDAIQRLLNDRPHAAGLAVPGMPVGSPGMEVDGHEPESYDVFLISRDGRAAPFMRYRGALPG